MAAKHQRAGKLGWLTWTVVGCPKATLPLAFGYRRPVMAMMRRGVLQWLRLTLQRRHR